MSSVNKRFWKGDISQQVFDIDSTDETCHHCDTCVVIHCRYKKTPSKNSCPFISCLLSCGATYHACKDLEHKELCRNEVVPCINATYGCPKRLPRKALGRHLATCPASVVFCTMEWNRWPVFSKERQDRVPFIRKNLHAKDGQLDVALAMRDQRILYEAMRAPTRVRRSMKNRLTERFPAVPLTINRGSYVEMNTGAVPEITSDDEFDGDESWKLSKSSSESKICHKPPMTTSSTDLPFHDCKQDESDLTSVIGNVSTVSHDAISNERIAADCASETKVLPRKKCVLPPYDKSVTEISSKYESGTSGAIFLPEQVADTELLSNGNGLGNSDGGIVRILDCEDICSYVDSHSSEFPSPLKNSENSIHGDMRVSEAGEFADEIEHMGVPSLQHLCENTLAAGEVADEAEQMRVPSLQHLCENTLASRATLESDTCWISFKQLRSKPGSNPASKILLNSSGDEQGALPGDKPMIDASEKYKVVCEDELGNGSIVESVDIAQGKSGNEFLKSVYLSGQINIPASSPNIDIINGSSLTKLEHSTADDLTAFTEELALNNSNTVADGNVYSHTLTPYNREFFEAKPNPNYDFPHSKVRLPSTSAAEARNNELLKTTLNTEFTTDVEHGTAADSYDKLSENSRNSSSLENHCTSGLSASLETSKTGSSDFPKDYQVQVVDDTILPPPLGPPPLTFPLILSLDLNLESITRYQAKPRSMYTFLCAQHFRRDEYEWHFKNTHSEIHGGLNGWIEARCPLASYGCTYSVRRLNPRNGMVIYSSLVDSFGVCPKPETQIQAFDNASGQWFNELGLGKKEISHEMNLLEENGLPMEEISYSSTSLGADETPESADRNFQLHASGDYSDSVTEKMGETADSVSLFRNRDTDMLTILPFEVLQYIALCLDSFSLCNLSLTSLYLRDVCRSIVENRGIVVQEWEKKQFDSGYSWQVTYQRWFFSTSFTPVAHWDFEESRSLSEHLKGCPYNVKEPKLSPFLCSSLSDPNHSDEDFGRTMRKMYPEFEPTDFEDQSLILSGPELSDHLFIKRISEEGVAQYRKALKAFEMSHCEHLGKGIEPKD